MGFYLRKGINFGPLRLNLSRSGLGASFGVKGARVGIGPKGSYIHMGRGGLYYRQSLTPSHRHYAPTPHYVPPTPGPAPVENLQEIKSSSAATLTDSSASDLLKELNRVKQRSDRFPIVLVLGGSALIVAASLGAVWWTLILTGFVTITFALWARHFDVLNGTAILNYSLESDASQRYSKLQTPFRQLTQCEKVWHIDAAGHSTNLKYHAGAGVQLERKETRPQFSKPPKVQCNMEVPVLQTKDATLYFFPDRLLVYDSAGIGSVPYSDLNVEGTQFKFVEHESVPRDAQQIDRTWQYVNKKGGPDRRFANNRELPVMQYGLLAFSSSHGLKAIFLCSRAETATTFVSAFSKAKTLSS
jgi:hypothetical protein